MQLNAKNDKLQSPKKLNNYQEHDKYKYNSS